VARRPVIVIVIVTVARALLVRGAVGAVLDKYATSVRGARPVSARAWSVGPVLAVTGASGATALEGSRRSSQPMGQRVCDFCCRR